MQSLAKQLLPAIAQVLRSAQDDKPNRMQAGEMGIGRLTQAGFL